MSRTNSHADRRQRQKLDISVNGIISLLCHNPHGLVFPNDALEAVYAELKTIHDGEELFTILVEHISIAGFLRIEKHADHAADQLLAMVARATVWLETLTDEDIGATTRSARVRELADAQRGALSKGPATLGAFDDRKVSGIGLRASQKR